MSDLQEQVLRDLRIEKQALQAENARLRKAAGELCANVEMADYDLVDGEYTVAAVWVNRLRTALDDTDA